MNLNILAASAVIAVLISSTAVLAEWNESRVFAMSLSGTANGLASSLSMNGTANGKIDINIGRVVGSIAISNHTFVLHGGWGKYSNGTIEIGSQFSSRDSRSELKLAGSVLDGVAHLNGTLKVTEKFRVVSTDSRGWKSVKVVSNDSVYILSYSGSVSGLNFSEPEKPNDRFGTFSINSSGKAGRNSSALSVAGVVKIDGKSGVFKLYNSTGSLTVGDRTFNVTKMTGITVGKKGSALLEFKVMDGQRGWVHLRAVISGFNMTNTEGAFPMQVRGTLALPKMPGEKHFLISYPSNSSSITIDL